MLFPKPQNKDRVGFYSWAGPGTIRMLNLKFFSPRIDTSSLMTAYDYDYLAKLKDTFEITDFWATYSWGFSPEVEQEDYEFLLSRVDNFHKLGIKLHAYAQGPNLVYSQFPGIDWFCEDEKGRPVTYYRGRRVTCLNNPGFREFIANKLEGMKNKGFDGIYMDNVQMGQLAIPTFDDNLPFVFCGCHCKYCREKFHQGMQSEIPTNFQANTEFSRKYLDWRVGVTNSFMQEMGNIVHSGNMEFGSNSFEPRIHTKYTFGTDLKFLNRIQDYILFENHSLPQGNGEKVSSSYIESIIQEEEITKPVFVLSYKYGIGMEPEFTQKDFDNIYTEDQACTYFAAIKGSEYLTKGKWHNLRIGRFNKPALNPEYIKPRQVEFKDGVEKLLLRIPLFKRFLRRYYNPLTTWFLESRVGRKALLWVYGLALR